MLPFKVIAWSLAAGLLAVTLRTRFVEALDGASLWLATMLAIYAIYYYGAATLYKRPVLFGAGNLAAGLAVLLGLGSAFGPPAVLALAVLSLLWSGLSWTGARVRLKRGYRRVLALSILLSTTVAYVIALWRHLHGLDILDNVHWVPVLTLDSAALFLTTVSLLVCAHNYLSRLPIYGALIAVAAIAPGATALSALLAWMGAEMLRRRVLFSRPLFEGALFFSLLGLLNSGLQMFRPGLAWAPLLFMPLAALVLGLLTWRYRSALLYGLALFFGYVSIHAAVQKLLLSGRPVPEMMSFHLVVAAVVALLIWAIATGYSAWCGRRLGLLSEEDQIEIRARRLFYGGLLHRVNCGMALLALLQLFLMRLAFHPESVLSLLLGAAGLLALFFALSGAVYQAPVWSYASLIALSLGVPNLVGVVGFPWPSGSANGVCLAALGFLLALLASRLWRQEQTITHEKSPGIFPSLWADSPFFHRGVTPLRLWAQPLAEFSILLALLGMLLVSLNWQMGLATPILATFWFSAAICVLGAWMYRGPALTYVAAGALWMSVNPLLAWIGQPSIESGTALTLLALVLWVSSFLAQRGIPALAFVEDRNGEPPFNRQHVYEIPLARCAVGLSLLAVIQGWFLWGSRWPLLLMAYLGAALVLFLSARNVHIAKRGAEARLFVYLAGLCTLAAQFTTVSIHWDGPALAVITAGFSLVLACLGLVLLNDSSWSEAVDRPVLTLRRVYGEPLVHLALVFPLLAIGLVLIQFDSTPAALTFLVTALTYLVAVRATGEEKWLHPAVILGGLSILVFAESLFQFGSGTFLVVTVMVMNLLLGLAHLVLRNRDRVAALLGVAGARCEGAVYLWPFIATVGVVAGQAIYYSLIIMGAAEGIDPHWSGLVTPLLAGLFFLHFFHLEEGKTSAHLLVATSLTGALWLAALGWLTVDVAIALLGLCWVVAAALLMRGPGYRALQSVGLQLSGEARGGLINLLQDWISTLLFISLALTIPTWVLLEPLFPNTGLTLLLVAFGCAAAGYLWQKAAWEGAAAVFLLGSVWAWLFWRSGTPEVMPWLGLVTVVFAGGYLFLSRILLSREPVESQDSFAAATARVLLGVAVACTLLSAVVAFFSRGTGPILLVALTMALTALCWLYLARDTKRELPGLRLRSGDGLDLPLSLRVGVWSAFRAQPESGSGGGSSELCPLWTQHPGRPRRG